MDTSVISDTPLKIVIIDPREHVTAIKDVMSALPSVQDERMSEGALDHMCRLMVLTIMTAIVNRRKAWVYADDADVEIHLMNLRELIGFDIDAYLREGIRDDLGHPDCKFNADMLDSILKSILETLTSHMNPNRFVLHRLTQGRDMRTLNLEEYADWRVIEWTRREQETVAARHETI